MNQPTTPNTAHTASIDSPEFLGRVIAAASEAMSIGPGKEWESFIAHINARLAPAAPSGEEVHQFRKWGCADWYDGFPDDSDGGGPYETRTLYTHPAPSEIEAAIELPPKPDPLEIEWPQLHSSALGCGVEDRNLHDRYEVADYAWQDGMDKAASCVPDDIYDFDQLTSYATEAVLKDRASMKGNK